MLQLAEPGDGHRRYPSSGDEVEGRACPGRVRVPCVDLVQRNEANNPEAHGQARKADREAIALDAVPSPQQAPDDQGHDYDRDGDACRNLQASAVFVPAPLLEDAAQEVSEPAQQAEAGRCLHQGQQEERTRQSRPDQCVVAWQAVVLGPSASNSGPQAEQAGDRQCRDTQDIVRHCSSLSPEQNNKKDPWRNAPNYTAQWVRRLKASGSRRALKVNILASSFRTFAEAFRAFKKIYLGVVDQLIDHLKSQEANGSSARS
jgi:hypothetical protein